MDEHVDGGTSRFDEQGIVYQSVCAGCGGNPFITYPNGLGGEYPQQNQSNNCNNGVFKFDLSSLEAKINTLSPCSPLSITFNNETLGGIDYHWFFGDGTDTLMTSKASVTHRYPTAGQYEVQLVTSDITTCKREDTTSIIVNVSDDLINQEFKDTLCLNETLLWTQFDTLSFISYEWEDKPGISDVSSQNPTFTALSSTNYPIKMTDSLGCERLDTFKLFVPEMTPEIYAQALPNCISGSFPKIQLTLNYQSNFSPDSIQWIVNLDTIQTPNQQYIYDPNEDGNFVINSSTGTNGCNFYDSTSVTTTTTEIPNVITPNGDEYNETFEITGIEETGPWTLNIYNRWNRLVFHSDNYKNDWVGLGDVNKENTYYYELIAPDGSTCKGWIQVLK